MSMSQEEIESLMNGLDIAEDEASDVATDAAEDLDALVPDEAPAQEAAPEPAVEETVDETGPMDNDSIDDLINSLDVPADEPEATPEPEPAPEVEASPEPEPAAEVAPESVAEAAPEPAAETVQTDDIDELLASIETTSDESENEQVDSSDIDDLLASLDGVGDDVASDSVESIDEIVAPEPEPAPVVETPAPEPEPVPEPAPADQENAKDFVEEKIQSGVFPLPADDESKVVTQLTAVAEDSEEKATKIFDVLSYILDENMAIDGSVTKMSKFMEEQEKVLQTLTAKFPNVDVFSSNLEMLQELKGEPQKIKDILNNENNELFSAMELMQYHDINRQKIERVMSVIRKLSVYLNNIFEDDNSHKEIAVAKHIAGDKNDDLVGDDDLDALIAEFGN